MPPRIVDPRSEPDARDADLREAFEKQASRGFLRPSTLDEYVGQGKAKESIRLFIAAAIARGESLDHVLLSGPPGLGKTTLAQIVAREMGAKIHVVTAPNIERKADLAALLTNLQERDVLFIDEIHRLQKPIEEVLYGAMEDFRIDFILGEGPGARTMTMNLPRFTLVGATTRSGLLSGPLRERFGIALRLEFYPVEELRLIVTRSARILSVDIDVEASAAIASRSRGTPRIANRLLRRMRDFAQVSALSKPGGVDARVRISLETVEKGLAFFEVDSKGLDSLDRRFLRAIIEKYDGGPVGIENLSAALGEERDTLEEVCEPFLIQEGFVQRTPRGRVATRHACEHLGFPTIPFVSNPTRF